MRGLKSTCVPTPAPTTTPTPAPPPPPIPGKDAYTADRTAHVIIPLTDPDKASETLTWNVSGLPSTFTNVKFSSNPTNSPHINSLSFDVGVNTIPQSYPLSITVTSAATGLISSASSVTISVPHVVGYYTLVNSSDLYETNAAKQVVVSDGSQYVSTGPIVVADFPGTSSGVATASIMRARQSTSPILPSGVNLSGTVAVCIDIASLVGAQDGKTPATINIDVTCANAEVISVNIATKSFGLNNNNFDASLPDLATQTATCQNSVTRSTPKNGGMFFSCSTGAVALNHYTSQATFAEISRTMNVYNDVLVKVLDVPLYWPLNAKGVSYPKIAFDGGNGNGVPFPDITSPLVNCPSAIRGTATCPKSVAETFRENTINYYATQGWMVPNGISIPRSGPMYQAHHILPSSCGGGDAEGNGIFLTQFQHTPFTNWWLAVPPCASSNVNK